MQPGDVDKYFHYVLQMLITIFPLKMHALVAVPLILFFGAVSDPVKLNFPEKHVTIQNYENLSGGGLYESKH